MLQALFFQREHLAFQDFQLIDFSVMEEDDLKKQKLAQVMMELLKYSRERDFENHLMRLIQEEAFNVLFLEVDEKNFINMIHYALLIAERYNCNGREVAEMIAARLPEESRPDRKRGKTLWDDFVESVMAEGIEKGGREALRTTAIKLIKLGLRDLDIAESTGLSIQEVQELKKPDCR